MAEPLNEVHQEQVLSFLRFAKYQRGQCLKEIKLAIQDTKDPRLTDSTYSLDEVEETIEVITDAVIGEVESELINSSHTHVLLLQQLFIQAEKWHLNLDTDLSELENRELLDKVRDWEASESAPKGEKLLEKKKLAPLNEGGPAQLLNLQIQKLEAENSELKLRIKTVENQAGEMVEEKVQLRKELEDLKGAPPVTNVVLEDNSEEIKQLSDTVEAVKSALETEKELADKSQKELEDDLTKSKHRYLEIQHQLSMAEKELEKKFSETGAYKNLKKMLSSKNDTIKELRKKLVAYEPADNEEEE